MLGAVSGRLQWRTVTALALALLVALAGCSAGAVSTQVSNVTGTGVAIATQVGPTAAATGAVSASGTTIAEARPTVTALATAAPGAIGSAVTGARPTAAALATNASGAFATAGAVATTLPGNGALRVGRFARKTQDGAGGVEVVATPGGTGVVRLGQDFSVTGGAKLAVYLTREASPGTRAEVERGFLDLGELRSTSGPDLYPVPRGTDLNAFAGVVIYATEQHVPYIAAPLGRP